MYILGIWCSYRLTIELNKVAQISRSQPLGIRPQVINGLGINLLDKRLPYMAMAWSILMPGLGHIYTTRLSTALVIIVAWLVTVLKSGFLPAVHLTVLGQFNQATLAADPEWLLFIPSIYCFALFDAYDHCVEYNKLFDREQAQFLRQDYQDSGFIMPL
jgi:hypothetical protein